MKTSSRTQIVHKSKLLDPVFAEGKTWAPTICGARFRQVIVKGWKGVTCKRCLKKK